MMMDGLTEKKKKKKKKREEKGYAGCPSPSLRVHSAF